MTDQRSGNLRGKVTEHHDPAEIAAVLFEHGLDAPDHLGIDAAVGTHAVVGGGVDGEHADARCHETEGNSPDRTEGGAEFGNEGVPVEGGGDVGIMIPRDRGGSQRCLGDGGKEGFAGGGELGIKRRRGKIPTEQDYFGPEFDDAGYKVRGEGLLELPGAASQKEVANAKKPFVKVQEGVEGYFPKVKVS